MSETDLAEEPAWDLRPKANHFTLLRLVLALGVILAHSFSLLTPLSERERIPWAGELGDLAVNSFFAVSGCLITASWLRSRSFGDYLRKRVLRIYPGYLAAGLICALGFAALGVPDVQAYYQELSLPRYLFDLVRLGMIQTPGAFADAPDPYLNGSSWTIQAEFICYLVVPLLTLFGAYRRPGVLLGLFAAFLTLYAVQQFLPQLAWCSAGGDSCWYELRVPLPLFWQGRWPRLLSSFLAGAAFLMYRQRIPHTGALAAVCLGVLACSLLSLPLFRVLWPICGTYVLFWLAWHPRMKSPAWMTHLDLSYGTYLYAYPIQQVLVRHVPGISPVLLFGTAMPIALAFAWGSWKLIESPCLRWKPKAKAAAQ
ncbi:MAG: Acyltransferase [Armatimonadetes bacterium]|nr:Acyltransferase [Armatimonadota bacterium]